MLIGARFGRRNELLGVLAVVIAILGVASLAPRAAAGNSMNAGELDVQRLERATEFRRLFGFDARLVTIRLAATDSTYSSDPYGVPLSDAERAELLRRVQVEIDIEAAVRAASKLQTWGGYYIDQLDRGAPVFLFTSRDEAVEASIGDLAPTGSGLKFRTVSRTLAELNDLHDQIVESWDVLRADGVDITHTGTDIVGNTVTVGIDGLDDAAVRKVTDRFGDQLTFVDRSPAQADACPTTNCTPIKAGIKAEGPSGSDCTAGPVVRRAANGGGLAVITAGHCVVANGGALNLRWAHQIGSTLEWPGDAFGDSKYHTFFDESTADVTIIEIDSDWSPAVANQMYLFNGSSGGTYTVTSPVLDQFQAVGGQACAYGFASNNSECVTITAVNQTNVSCIGAAPCADIRHTNEYGWNLIGGDSGGPIYRVVSGTNNRQILGTHVHSDAGGGAGTGWYSTYERGKSAYNIRTINAGNPDSYVLCYTAAC